jgi:hypothetical protein
MRTVQFFTVFILNRGLPGSAFYDLGGTGKNLGVLTEIPPLWFAGA